MSWREPVSVLVEGKLVACESGRKPATWLLLKFICSVR